MSKKVVAFSLVALLAVVYILDTYTPITISHSLLMRSFLHANIAHLVINCYALYTFIMSPLLPYSLRYCCPMAYVISVFAFACSPTCAVGASGFIFALLGMIVARHFTKRNILICAIFIAFSLLPQLATTVHIVSLLLGFTSTKLIDYARQYV